MSQERVWQKLGRGEGGFQMSHTFSRVESDIFLILQQISKSHFAVTDLSGTRTVRRFASDQNLYGGNIRLDCLYCRPTPSPLEKVYFHLRRDIAQTKVTICYDEWRSPSCQRDLWVHIRHFVRREQASAFREIILPKDSDPFSKKLWLGEKAPFSAREQWLCETEKAKFVFC